MKRYLAFIGALLLALGIAPALADTRTALVGDSGGTAFTASCGPGEALSGFAYNSSHLLMAVGALCRPYADGGVTGPVQKIKSVYGLEGGDSNKPVICPEDRPVVTSLSVGLSAVLRVHSVRTECRLPGANTKAILLKATGTTEGAPAASQSTRCDTYATGIIGTYGGGILSLGLLCFEPGKAAPPKPDTADTGGGDDGGKDGTFSVGGGGLKFDVQINLPGAKGGNTLKAKEATTIYARPAGKEIAYLKSGAPVTIKGCEDGLESWCEITKPTPGWVWGGDFR